MIFLDFLIKNKLFLPSFLVVEINVRKSYFRTAKRGLQFWL